MPSNRTHMKSGNKGLTVKINLWEPMDGPSRKLDTTAARLWIRGQVSHADRTDVKMFNDAGELVTILGKWNVEKFKESRRDKKASNDIEA